MTTIHLHSHVRLPKHSHSAMPHHITLNTQSFSILYLSPQSHHHPLCPLQTMQIFQHSLLIFQSHTSLTMVISSVSLFFYIWYDAHTADIWEITLWTYPKHISEKIWWKIGRLMNVFVFVHVCWKMKTRNRKRNCEIAHGGTILVEKSVLKVVPRIRSGNDRWEIYKYLQIDKKKKVNKINLNK